MRVLKDWRGITLFMLQRTEVNVLKDAGVDIEVLGVGVQFFDKRRYAAGWAEIVGPVLKSVCYLLNIKVAELVW